MISWEIDEFSGKTYLRKDASEVFSSFGVTPPHILTRVVAALPEGSWVAGGYLTSVLQHTDILGDVDVWFTGEPAADAAYDALKTLFASTEMSEYAWETLPNKQGFTSDKHPKVSLNRFLYKADPTKTLDQFDFTVSQLALCTSGFYVSADALADIRARRLRVHRLQEKTVLRRTVKYAAKGYVPTDELIAEIQARDPAKAIIVKNATMAAQNRLLVPS